MTNTALQPAYVLHSRRFRESSLIVEFLTRDHGRLAALAKGAIRGKAPRQPLLQPFLPLLIDWRGRGELPLLVALEPAAGITQATGLRLYCGLYVNELVLNLTERRDPHSELFSAYALCMTELLQAGEQNASLEPILRRFEVSLLEKLGLGLTLQRDCDGKPIQQTARYRFDVQEGAVPCLTGTAHGTVQGTTLIALRDGEFADPVQRSEARGLMRAVLSFHLGGRELKSRELFKRANTKQTRA